MKNSYLEHANLTVQNPEKVASLFCRLFDWKIRWEGDALDNGRTIHVGCDDSYLALYTHQKVSNMNTSRNHLVDNNFNHLGVVVTDLDEVELKLKEEGFKPFSYGDYDPGRRFYFLVDGLEVEVISYTNKEDSV